MNNVDYLCKGINAEVLRGTISKVVLSIKMRYANAVAIYACVAELMMQNAKYGCKMQILAKFSLKPYYWVIRKGH